MIKIKPCGAYQTNCYVLKIDQKEFIIDPGVDAYSWLKNIVTNPLAIINTHGHFDHVWDNAKVSKEFNIPIVCHRGDENMLGQDLFGLGTPSSNADIVVEGDGEFEFEGVKFGFLSFPGHTEGSMAIIYEDKFFSGDFLFRGSIGRVDLPGSDSKKMVESIRKVLSLQKNYEIYPGHGNSTTLQEERQNLGSWIDSLEDR